MKTLKSNHRKKSWAVTAILVIVILAACGILWWFLIGKSQISNARKNTDVNYGKPSHEQKQAGDQIKAEARQTKTGGSDQPSAPTPIPNSNQQQVGVTITAAQPSGSQYLVRTVINAVSSTGTCTLTMEKPGSPTVTMSTGTQPLASTSTCKGFNVPLSSLSSGTWNLSIKFSDGNLVGGVSTQVSI